MMTKKIMQVLAVAFFLGACQAQTGQEASSEVAETKTVTVTDAAGEKELPFQPERVVVYDYGMLDTMLELGLDENVVGAPTNNAPGYLADFLGDVENVGTLKEPDVEKLVTLDPDLIIISDRLADFSDQLEQIAPVLQVTIDQADYLKAIKTNVGFVAELYDVDAEAPFAELEAQVRALKEKTVAYKNQEALLLMLNDGAISAFSSGSRFGQLFDVFGFQPVAAEIETSTHGQAIGYEGILEINPDILFVIDRSQAVQADAESQFSLLDNEFIAQTEAAKTDRIITLAPDLWYLSGGGLQSTKLMVEEINAAIE